MSTSITPIRRRRIIVDRVMRAFMMGAVGLALTPLVWILFEVAKRSAGALSLRFFTQGPPGDPTSSAGGVWNGILGTMIMVGLAAAMAIPVGVLGAIYLAEYAANSRLARTIRFFGDVMTGVPSIVFGIFVYTVIVATTKSFSAFAGAVSIAMIMWPVILRTSEQMLVLVPREIREASHALGVSRRRTILRVVLPTAAGGMVTGTMLAVARAAGETAPLLFTALGNQFVSHSVTKPMSALPLEIFRGATSAFAASQARAWASALTLIILILSLTFGSRILVTRRTGGIA